jgi:hypothetical protein
MLKISARMAEMDALDSFATKNQATAKVTTVCPSCSAALRVPGQKRGTATCPRCKRVFAWEPEVHEQVELQFRCAVTSEQYSLTFSRARQSEMFRFVSPVPQARNRAASTTASSTASRTDYDASQFSFGGFRCASCRFAPKEDASAVIRCGTCAELVCGGRVKIDPAGGEWFRCHDGCTGCGSVGGAMTTVAGRRVAVGRDTSTNNTVSVGRGSKVELQKPGRGVLQKG